MHPPAHDQQPRDIHDTVWTFHHIFRGGENTAPFGQHNGSMNRTFHFYASIPPPRTVHVSLKILHISLLCSGWSAKLLLFIMFITSDVHRL